jgi:hypothetical protein
MAALAAWHLLVHVLGVDQGLPYGAWDWYNFASGSGSDIGEFAIAGSVVGMVRRCNCEVKGCWRLGRHATAAGHGVCRRHHPDGHLTAEQVEAAHRAALARAVAAGPGPAAGGVPPRRDDT